MRYKKVKLISVMLFCLMLTAFGQSSILNVTGMNSKQTSYPLSGIKTLTFSSGNMMINHGDSTTTSSLSTVRNLNFTIVIPKIPSNIQQPPVIKDNLLLFPNPVSNQLQLRYQTVNAGILDVEILDLQGKIVQQQKLMSQDGMNLYTFNVSQLINGIYLCLIRNGNHCETLKFIKN